MYIKSMYNVTAESLGKPDKFTDWENFGHIYNKLIVTNLNPDMNYS